MKLSLCGAVALAVLAAAGTASAAPPPWSGASYHGRGTGNALSTKDSVMLHVSAAGTTVPTYAFRIDTLCGVKNLGGRETYIWPFTSKGSPPLSVSSTGAFSSTQRGSFTVPVIPTVTKAREPGTYLFSVVGRFNPGGRTASGHLTLKIQTGSGDYCVDTDSPFTAKETG